MGLYATKDMFASSLIKNMVTVVMLIKSATGTKEISFTTRDTDGECILLARAEIITEVNSRRVDFMVMERTYGEFADIATDLLMAI